MTAAFLLVAAIVAQPRGEHAAAVPTQSEIDRAIRELGSDDYRTRESATSRLWVAGAVAETALRAALTSTDAEVVARARGLLDVVPYGITPEMPRRYAELIAAARVGGTTSWPGVVAGLLDLGPRGLEVARKLAEKLPSTPGQQSYLAQLVDQEGWRVVAFLLAEGRDDAAEEVLERSAVAGATVAGEPVGVKHFVAMIVLRGRLSAQLDRWKRLAAANESRTGPGNRLPDGQPDGKASAVILSYLARLNGEFDVARQAAERAGRAELVEAALFDSGAWGELAQNLTPAAGYPEIRTALRVAYSRMAGKAEEAERALAELKSLPASTGSTAPPLVFRALMFVGRPEDALASVANSPAADAIIPRAEVLAQQGKYADALRALEGPIALRYHRWQRDAARVRIYQQLGQAEKLREVLRECPGQDRLTSADSLGAQEFIEQLVALQMTSDALPVAAALLTDAGVNPEDVFGKLFPRTPLAAETWWRFLRTKHATEPAPDTMARVPLLLDRRLNSDEGKALVDRAVNFGRNLAPVEADRWLRGLAEACHAGGLDDRAEAILEDALGRFPTAAGHQALGELRAERKQFAAAARAFEAAWRVDVRQPLPAWLAGWAMTRAGDPAGARMAAMAHMLPLGDEEVRGTFAEELAKRTALAKEATDAVRRERQLAVRLSLPSSNRGRNLQSSLTADPLAHSDRLAAADATRRFLVRMIQTNAYFKRNEGYLAVLARLHDHSARGLLAKGDVAGAVREAQAAHRLIPSHSGMVVGIVPELVKRGNTVEADQVYAPVAAVLDGLCREYPASAHFANQRAWLAARCRRDLPKARDLADRAVTLGPTNPAYQETLAEVQFQRGDSAAALAAITRALALDPKNEYYRKQKARIEAGDPAAPVPESGR